MAKIPKLSELTDVRGMVDKVKSAVDSLMGPDTAGLTEEALAKEKDPVKAKLLEIELLINQLHDVQLIQAKTIAALKVKYADVHKLAAEAMGAKPESTETESSAATDTTAESPAEKSAESTESTGSTESTESTESTDDEPKSE